MPSIFTKIVRGEIPCHKILEDEKHFAFLEIRPLKPGHTLVIPKKETDYFLDLSDAETAGLMGFAKKVAAASAVPGLQPILCIGEDAEARKNGTYLSLIRAQLTGALRQVPKTKRTRMVIAYEPLWALSTAVQLVGTKGRPITPDDCAEVYHFLKKTLARARPLMSVTMLYGGSVNAGNIRSFVKSDVSDGALIGGASVDRDEMMRIIELLSQRYLTSSLQ